MKALSELLCSAICSRHRSRTASAVVSRDFKARERCAIVWTSASIALLWLFELAAGVAVPLGGPQRRGRTRKDLEQRFQFRDPATLSIVDRGIEPRFDRHIRASVLQSDCAGKLVGAR